MKQIELLLLPFHIPLPSFTSFRFTLQKKKKKKEELIPVCEIELNTALAKQLENMYFLKDLLFH